MFEVSCFIIGSKTQRAALPDEVPASQAKPDCLDYLIYKFRKEG